MPGQAFNQGVTAGRRSGQRAKPFEAVALRAVQLFQVLAELGRLAGPECRSSLFANEQRVS